MNLRTYTQRQNKFIFILLLIWGVLILVSAGCVKGEVITPAEATARAKASRAVKIKKTATPGGKTEAGGDVIPSGSQATLIGKAYLINIYKEPGSTRIHVQQEKGVEVTIQDATKVNGETWYLIDAPAGQGWVKAENLEIEQGDGAAAKVKTGDIVYLTGKSYLINLYQEPDGKRIIAQQERGMAVTVEDSLNVDGEIWYLVDAPTGLGWVHNENITPEKP
ncbi:MAG TPA: hypothetical protein EYP25_08600 [Anaerolineae bacterium]|nr:hypothetical protein [Anaerolineae bacterium]